jgi:hypothetical protein
MGDTNVGAVLVRISKLFRKSINQNKFDIGADISFTMEFLRSIGVPEVRMGFIYNDTQRYFLIDDLGVLCIALDYAPPNRVFPNGRITTELGCIDYGRYHFRPEWGDIYVAYKSKQHSIQMFVVDIHNRIKKGLNVN